MPIETLDETTDAARLEVAVRAVREILERMGVSEVAPDSVLTAPHFYKGKVLLRESDRFGLFAGQFAMRFGCIPYSSNDAAFMTPEAFARYYLQESYPEIPSRAIRDADYEWVDEPRAQRTPSASRDLPVCFVLGAARSGTTLFRSMLNVHSCLWAPGELHLANFETMGERAGCLTPPLLRYMPIPEIAERTGVASTAMAAAFREWERLDRSVPDIYEELYRADPDAIIVDKTPSYSASLDHLQRIGEWFPNAKFIQLLRNPSDVVQSLVRTQLYKGTRSRLRSKVNPYHIAEVIWAENNWNIERFFGDLPAARRLRLRYEELVSEPEPALAQVCGFLGVDLDPRMANPYQDNARVASGAGDMKVNLLREVERRVASEPFYPLSSRCLELADRYGY